MTGKPSNVFQLDRYRKVRQLTYADALQEVDPDSAKNIASEVVKQLVTRDQQSGFDTKGAKARFHQVLESSGTLPDDSDFLEDLMEQTQEIPVLPDETHQQPNSPNAQEQIDNFLTRLHQSTLLSVADLILISKATDIYLTGKTLPDGCVDQLYEILADEKTLKRVLSEEIAFWENLPEQEYAKWNSKYFRRNRIFHPLFFHDKTFSPNVMKLVILILHLVKKHILNT